MCAFTNQSETEYIQIMIQNFRRSQFHFLTESLYQKGSAKAIPEYFRIGENEITCCSLPAWCIFSSHPLITTSHFTRQVVKFKIAGKPSNKVKHIISFAEFPYPISQ